MLGAIASLPQYTFKPWRSVEAQGKLYLLPLLYEAALTTAVWAMFLNKPTLNHLVTKCL
jgi:hypothetical protein